jgi:hypothetical protein
VSYSNAVIRAYANGELFNTYNGGGNIGDVTPSQNDFRIAGRQAAAQYYSGGVDEMVIYNRALTSSEIANLIPPSRAIYDTDGDGLPDVVEDANGNGSSDSGETDWMNYDSGNGLSGEGDLQVYTPIKP